MKDIEFNEEIDELYSPSKWSKKMGPIEIMTNYFMLTSSASEEVRRKIPAELNVSYGNTARQAMDIFGAETLPKDAPIFVFLHGGYWMMGCREDSSWMVEPLYKSGIVTVVVGYDLAPKVTIGEIIREISDALAYIANYAETRKSKGVYICGHSAGAHLAAMALSSEYLLSKCNTRETMKGFIAISGVYKLLPLLQTNVARDLNLTREMCEDNSPLYRIQDFARHFGDKKPFVLIVVGEQESPAYFSQSKEYHEALLKEGFKSEYLTVPDEDHFSVVENLKNTSFQIVKDIVSRIKA